MTDKLSYPVVACACYGDPVEVAQVLDALQPRLSAQAAKAARRITQSGPRFAELHAEFLQVAQIAAWQAFRRFEGDSVDAFLGFIHVTVERKLMDAVREERTGGVGADRDAVWILGSMMEAANGDVFRAAELAQTVPPKGRRLSKERAYAARMAWLGRTPLDGLPDVATSEHHSEEPNERQNANTRRVERYLSYLPYRRRLAVAQHFGIGDVGTLSEQQLADRMLVSVPVLRTYRSKGLKSLRSRLA